MIDPASVAAGVAAGIAAEQSNKFIEQVRGEEAAHNEHTKTLLQEIRDFLRVLADRQSSALTPPLNKTIALQQYPASWQVPEYSRPHLCIFVPSGYNGTPGAIIPSADSITLLLELPTGGFHVATVPNGWTTLDLLPGTLVSLASGPASWPVTFSFRDDALSDSLHGTLPGESALATLSQINANVSSVQFLAANAARRGALVYNDSSANLFLAFAATASTTAYTVKIPGGGFYTFDPPIYTGPVSGIWDAAIGAARLTEQA